MLIFLYSQYDSDCKFSITAPIQLLTIPTRITTMDPYLQDELLKCYNSSLEWSQTFKIVNNSTEIDITQACGLNACPLPSAIDQPKIYPDRSYFRFPKCYCGEESLAALIAMIKDSLPGATFIKVRGQASKYNRYALHCSHSVKDSSKSQTYKSDSFRQIGVKKETVKRTKTQGMLKSIDRMAGKEETNAIIASKSSKVSGYSKNQPLKRQVHSARKSSITEVCRCKVTFFMWPDGYYYLDRKSNFQHNGHRFIPPSENFHNSNSISDEFTELIERSSTIGLKASTVRDLLQVMDGSDKRFKTKTISNMLHKFEVLANNKLGISHDMSTAEKAILYLSR
jgi:hypothetical protein